MHIFRKKYKVEKPTIEKRRNWAKSKQGWYKTLNLQQFGSFILVIASALRARSLFKAFSVNQYDQAYYIFDPIGPSTL